MDRPSPSRIASAEPLATLWGETLLEEEVEIQERAAAISHAIIAEMFSNRMITVGQTTADDLRYFYWQRVSDLGLEVSFSPFVSIRPRSPETLAKYGKDDKTIRPGDMLHCDVGVKYMRWNSDHQEVAYVLKRRRDGRARGAAQAAWPKPTGCRTSTAASSRPA